jgi:hypothetical protein
MLCWTSKCLLADSIKDFQRPLHFHNLLNSLASFLELRPAPRALYIFSSPRSRNRNRKLFIPSPHGLLTHHPHTMYLPHMLPHLILPHPRKRFVSLLLTPATPIHRTPQHRPPCVARVVVPLEFVPAAESNGASGRVALEDVARGVEAAVHRDNLSAGCAYVNGVCERRRYWYWGRDGVGE